MRPSFRLSFILPVFALVTACGAEGTTTQTQDTETPAATSQEVGTHELAAEGTTYGIGGIVYAKGAQGAAPIVGNANVALLQYWGGPVTTNQAVTSIFWGKSWRNTSFSSDKITGIDHFYQGVGNSNYATTCDEYNDSTGAQVNPNISYTGHIMDYSAAATGDPSASQILAEVCKRITKPVANGYYPVYTDTPRGNNGFCAWHSAGTCNGVTVRFGFFFALDNDPGCNPGDTTSGHSEGLAALANVSGHELSEMRTDPLLNAWYDANGAENGDKCAWTFGPSLVRFHNGYSWKIQGNFSNAAYNAGRGYAGSQGCIDGNE